MNGKYGAGGAVDSPLPASLTKYRRTAEHEERQVASFGNEKKASFSFAFRSLNRIFAKENIEYMTATTQRISTSFRLQSTLLDELKAKAKASNRSLNNYVESLLVNLLHPATPAMDAHAVTPELQGKIDKAMMEFRAGETKHFEDTTEMNRWLDAL